MAKGRAEGVLNISILPSRQYSDWVPVIILFMSIIFR